MTKPQTDPLLTSYLQDVNLLYQDWQTTFQVDTEVARYSVTDDDPGDEEAKRIAMVTWIDAQSVGWIKRSVSTILKKCRWIRFA